MPDTVQEFFETLPSRADTSKTAGMNNSYAFDIEGAGQWTVKVTDGDVSVHDGTGGRRGLHDQRLPGDLREDHLRRAEPDERLHDRQAQAQGRHGRRDEAPEALLAGD